MIEMISYTQTGTKQVSLSGLKIKIIFQKTNIR